MPMTLLQAERLVHTATLHAETLGVAVCVAVLDAGGHLTAFSRMDHAWLGSIDVAIKKAKTSVLFQTDSESVWEFSKPGAQAHGLDLTNGILVTFAGGLPLKSASGEMLGAIGVSGGLVNQDREVALAGQRALADSFPSPSRDIVEG